MTFQLGKDRTLHTIRCNRLVVADGVRSPLGRVLGREWHRDTAYGVAGRSYVKSGRSDDPWISSHLELRGEDDELLPGYGGSSRSATVRSTSASAHSPPPSGRPSCRYVR